MSIEDQPIQSVPTLRKKGYQQLLRELLNGTMVNEWGFGDHLEPVYGAEFRSPKSKDISSVRSKYILVPYFTGYFKVDFFNREVHLDAIDQKTPAEKHWVLEPSPEWWLQAMSCPWPLVG